MGFSTFNPGTVKVHRRTKLPHWDAAHGIQFVTFRTAARRRLSDSDAQCMAEVINHDDGTSYRLLAWCVMPDHVHAILHADSIVGMIVKTWKSVSARRIAGGPLWQRDYFDRLIRDERELRETVEYVMNNPDAAALDHWDHKMMYTERLAAIF